MSDEKFPTDFDSYNDFAKELHNSLPEEWSTTIDKQSMKQNHDRIGFQRDDLYRFMLSLPSNSEWPVDSIGLYIPTEIDKIADRPGIPVHHLEHPSIDAILTVLKHEAPDYQGTFTYDDD